MHDPLKILVVEDQPSDVRLLEEALVDCSVPTAFEHAQDGEAAIDYLYAHAVDGRPDVIILDLNMPRKDGQEFLDEMKTFLEREEIPVIMLTVSERQEDLTKALNARLNFFLSKPVESSKLDRILKAINTLWIGHRHDHRISA